MKPSLNWLRSLSKRPIITNVVLAVVHVLAAELGLLLAHPDTRITVIWPPAGIALAAFLLLGYQVWPGFFVGGVVLALLEGFPPILWIVVPMANTVSAVIGAWALQTFVDFNPRLRRMSDIVWLGLLGGLLSSLVSATLGAGSIAASGQAAAQEPLTAWLTWWLSNTIGVALVAPGLLVFGIRLREEASTVRLPRLKAVIPPFALLVAANLLVFGGVGRLFPRRSRLPVAFAVYPALVWIAMRFGLAGSAVSVLITGIAAVAGTTLGYGPFAGPAVSQNLGVLWSFVGVTALTALTLGAEVTERRRAEEELALRRQLWDSLMANTPDLVYFKDADHGLIRASRAYADAVGHDPAELVGKTAAELWPHEAEEIMADERSVLAGEPLIRKEREVTTAAGESRWYLLTKAPIYQDGEVIGFFAVDKDITERKLAEERLAFQSMLLDQIQDQITASDLNGRITYVNAAKCRALGRTADELIGESAAVYDHEPHGSATVERILEATLTHGRWRGEVTNITADGREIILDSRAQLIHDEDGEPVGLLGISTEITDQKAMEKQLRHQEQLAAVGQLASGIAHDFRNSLTTIILYAGLPLRRPDLPAELRENLKTVIGEAEKATDLVQQILDFSSSSMIETGQLDMEQFLADVLDILGRTLPESVAVTLETGSGPCVVEADAGRLQQAVTNLALNARDAMPNGGQLRFRLSRVAVSADARLPIPDLAPGEWICLEVSDTGTGMTEEVQQHLFEPFFTTKPVGEGTGLGLAQVYGIVRQHGGAVDVETEIGKGTTFRLYLPACGQSADESVDEEQTVSPTAVPRGRGERILLVEDEENVRDAARSILETLGYQVLTAGNGYEALALCQSPRWSRSGSPIDLIVTDMVMPEIGGRELMKKLHKRNHGLKAVAVTGYAIYDGAAKTLEELGFVEIVQKPFEADDLARSVRRALDA